MPWLAWSLLCVAVLAAAAALFMWRRARKEAGSLRRQLARAEDSCFRLRREFQALQTRMASADTELNLHRELAKGDMDASPSEPPAVWADTEAFDNAGEDFVRTQPGVVRSAAGTDR